MSDFRINWDWLPASGVKAPELRATWARLEISIDRQCVTLVEDLESASSRRSVYLPIYPIAEWIAFNWWLLTANSRPATILSRLPNNRVLSSEPLFKTYLQRHGLRGAGDGFLWPDLLVLPEGGVTRFVWHSDMGAMTGRQVRYLTSGQAVVDSDIVRQRLSHLVESVLERLEEQQIGETALKTEWSAIQSATAEETDFCIAAAHLGLDPYAEADVYEDDILAASSALADRGLLVDFLDSVEPTAISTSLDWVGRTLSEIQGLAVTGRGVSKLRSELGTASLSRFDSGFAPWERGWEQARVVRGALGLDPGEAMAFDGLLTTIDRTSPVRNLQALGGMTPSSVPLVALGQQLQTTTRRFTLARALWHVLWGDRQEFLVTNAHTDRQKAERAFAAELLAPADGIAEKVGGDVLLNLDDEALDAVSQAYSVSPILVQHQVDNQLLGPLPGSGF